MIPVPPATKAKILSWLPHVLDGYDYPVIETDNVLPELDAPAITFYFSSAGTPSQFSAQCLRTVRRPTLAKDEYWGQYHFATMNVVLRSNDKDELEVMWSEFLAAVMATRRNMVIWLDLVRFVEVLDSKQLDPQRLDNGQNLYWAQVDLRFEYESSAIPSDDYILRANVATQAQRDYDQQYWLVSDGPEFVTELAEHDATVNIVVYVTAPE